MKIFLKNKYLILILILGAILRFSYLSSMPPALNWDEISHGYNAYSILKTGRDEWGQLMPILNFRAYGDYPLPLNLYLTIPSIAVFGLTLTAIRLPHALLGTLTIVSVYFLVMGLMNQALTKKRNFIALIAAFLTAIDPWFLFPSRAVFQSNLSIFFLIASMAMFFNREKHKWLMPLTFLFLGLTLFSYHSTRIFTPLFLVIMIFIYKKEFLERLKERKLGFLISIFFIILFFVPLPFILLSPTARARSNVVFLLDQGAVNQINELRNNSSLPFKKLIYNKVTYFSGKFIENYFVYFSPQFLFLKGGTQYQFSVPYQGLLYLFNLPIFYLGLIVVLLQAIKREDRNYKFLLAWLIIAPIPAAITLETGAVIRATTMLPLPEILVAFGLYEIIRRFSKYEILIICGFVVCMFFSLENYMNIYINDYRVNYSEAWQYGYKEAVGFSETNYNNYDKIIVTKKYGEPHEFFLFFMKYDPAKYKSDPSKISFYQSNWYWVDHFDKFWFVNDWQMKDLITESKHKIDCLNQKCLVVTTADNAPKGFKKINEVKFLDGKVAFEMYEN